jgi:hypothetical protein
MTKAIICSYIEEIEITIHAYQKNNFHKRDIDAAVVCCKGKSLFIANQQ